MATRKPNLSIPVHDGRSFAWTGSVGLGEASDLGKAPWARVWSDACDVGFQVRSHRTGKVILFTLAGEDRSPGQGEVMAWNFTSDDGKFTIVIVND